MRWAFTHVYASNWHPLTWLSHMLDCRMYRLHAGGHHLTSVLLHAAACSNPARGASPILGDAVEVHYSGSLIDGTVFDSSLKRGVPATFDLRTMLPGISAALQRMKVGDKWRLFIPPEIGCGEYGAPGVGPNSAIVLEVELLSFFTPKSQHTALIQAAPQAPAR